MKTTTRRTSFFISTARKCFLLVVGVWQMNAHAAALAEPENETTEEITILGQKHPTLRLRATQKDMFALYNSLNTDDDNDVNCGYAPPRLGTRMRQWTCDFVFIEKEQQREIDEYLRDGGTSVRPRTKEELLVDMKPRINSVFDEMRALADSHPELYNVVQDYTSQNEKMKGKNK